MNLGVDPRHADQMVRGVCNLPNGSGRTVRVAVFARGAKADEAKAAGADIVGAEDLVEIVNGGKIDFDRCIATPDMMPLVGRLGKVLGPRGLMPNPKVGTVTMDVDGRRQGRQGRRGRVPRREGRHRPCRHRQGLVRRRASSSRTSGPSRTRSPRRSRRAPRAPTSSASRSPRPWARASRSSRPSVLATAESPASLRRPGAPAGLRLRLAGSDGHRIALDRTASRRACRSAPRMFSVACTWKPRNCRLAVPRKGLRSWRLSFQHRLEVRVLPSFWHARSAPETER